MLQRKKSCLLIAALILSLLFLFAVAFQLNMGRNQSSYWSASSAGGGLAETGKRCESIADVTILHTISEGGDAVPSTFFRAVVNDDFLGRFSQGEVIRIRQDGTAASPFEGYPLFQKGERLILPLNPSRDGATGGTGSSYFWIAGGASGVFGVVEQDGELYAVSQYAEYPELASGQRGGAVLEAKAKAFAKSGRTADAEADPAACANRVFPYADIKAAFTGT